MLPNLFDIAHADFKNMINNESDHKFFIAQIQPGRNGFIF